MAEDHKTTILSEQLDSKQTDEDPQSDVQYLSSLLNELKQIADAGGHKLLFHLIEMAALEADHIANASKTEQNSNQQLENE